MPLLNKNTSFNRKQHVRLRKSTALMPATYVASPLINTEIRDVGIGESGSPVRRVSSRPRIKTNKIAQLEASIKKNTNKIGIINDGNNENQTPRQKSIKRKDISQKTENIVSPPLKRRKYFQAGPITSYLNRPFDRIKISEQMKQKIIKNQPILQLQRINDCLFLKNKKISNKSFKERIPPAPVKEPIESVVREPIFIAVEDDHIESNVVPQSNDTIDTNISSTVVCRLCGVAGPNRFSLIGIRSERLNLLCHLKNYLNIEIFNEENLPLHICPLCSQTILSFSKFHGRVKTATNRLQAIVNENTLSPQRNWERVPWYGDNILATATATNDYLTRKHLRRLEYNKSKGQTKSNSTKFITTNIEKLFGNKSKIIGIDPDLIVEETIDNENPTNEDWLVPEHVTERPTKQKSKQISKNIDTSNMQIETITVDDDDEPPITISSNVKPKNVQRNKFQTVPRLVLAKPPAMTPKPASLNNTISILNSPNSTDNSSSTKAYLIPIQNLVGAGVTSLNQGSPLKFALSSGAQSILLQTSGANTLKFIPCQNEKNITTKPLTTIKGIANNLQNSTTPVNHILTTSNTAIPIQTISPVAAIVSNTSSALKSKSDEAVCNLQSPLKPKLESTVVLSPKAVDRKSSILQQTLTSPKVSISSPKLTPSKNTAKISINGKNSNTPTIVKNTIAKNSSSLKSVSTPPPNMLLPAKTNGKKEKITTASTSSTTQKMTVSKSTATTSTSSTTQKMTVAKSTATASTSSTTQKMTVSKSTVAGPTNSPSKTKSDIPDCLPLDSAEEKELNLNFRLPSKDDKYTYVVRMDRNVGEQPYFILTANPVKLKSPELTKHNVGIICKDVYKAEVEKKHVQENQGNFSNIGLHCWAQHIVWLWQLKLPGNVRIYVKQSADKILKFGQRKRNDFAKKCFEISKQICTEAANKSKTSTTLPKLTPKEIKLSTDILSKLIPIDAPAKLPKLLPKDNSIPPGVVTTQQLVLIPVTNTSNTGDDSPVTYVISPDSNVTFQDIISYEKSSNSELSNRLKLVSSNIHPISSTKQISSLNNEPMEMVHAADDAGVENMSVFNSEAVEIATSSINDDGSRKIDETNKIQIVYNDNDGEGMFDVECISDDEDHQVSTNNDILNRTKLDMVDAGDVTIAIDDNNTPNVQIETIDFDPTTPEMGIHRKIRI